MVHHPHPHWWRSTHCAFCDADFLERVAVCRARSQAALARHKATRSSQAGGCTSPGFEDVIPPLSDKDKDDRDTAVGNDDVSSVSPSVALDNNAPFAECRARRRGRVAAPGTRPLVRRWQQPAAPPLAWGGGRQRQQL